MVEKRKGVRTWKNILAQASNILWLTQCLGRYSQGKKEKGEQISASVKWLMGERKR
jgi:hypothetical protein